MRLARDADGTVRLMTRAEVLGERLAGAEARVEADPTDADAARAAAS